MAERIAARGASSRSLPSAATAWMGVAGASLVLATLYALAVVVFRLPFFVGSTPQLFRTALVLHVELAVFVFLVATMAAQWAAATASTLTDPTRRIGGADRASLLPALIAALGTVLLALSPLAGGKPVMLDYFPMLDGNPLFAAGFGLICLGLLIAAINTLRARPTKISEALRLTAWAVLMAALAMLGTASRDGATLVELAWATGHTLLFAHVMMLGHEWTRHADAGPAIGRWPLRLLAAASTLMPLIPFLYLPGTPEFFSRYTAAMTLLLWPPALWLAWKIWRDPTLQPSELGQTVLRISIALFIVGCLIGTLISAPTTLITAHYHATMGAVAISRMGIAYRDHIRPGALAPGRQLLTYALGLTLLAGGLALAAIEGAPRKTAASELVVHGPYFVVGMSLSGLGGIVAMVGTGWWVFNLLGRRHAVRAGKLQESQQ